MRVGDGYLPIIVVNHRVTNGAEPRNGERPSLRTSPLSEWNPAPDATRSMRSQRRDVMRLAQLAAMLDHLGRLHAPRTEALGGLIGLDADCIVEIQLGGETAEEYDASFERRRAIAEGLVATAPRKISECRSCHWWPRCEAELTQARDVSLVVGGNQGQVLRDAGILTIDQLADYRGREPEWAGSVPFEDTVVSAKCWVGEIPLVRRHARPRVQRADIEVDVDMESFSERGAYMWGTLLTDNTDPSREVLYRPFVTWDPLPSRDEGGRSRSSGPG